MSSKYSHISTFRNEHGEGYYTLISDEIIVRWKPLSIERFFFFEDLIRNEIISFAVIEDEIFQQCVLDKELLKDINYLPAGIISTVVQNIISYSGPSSVDDFNEFLDINRNLSSSPLNELAPLILRAFPSYKLEEIYTMPYEIFMLRLAQAESLLLKLGIIKEPIFLASEKKEVKKKKPNLSPDQLKAIWEGEHSPMRKNLDEERQIIEQASGSMLAEDPAERAKMVNEAANIYKNKLSEMDFYKKKG